MSFSFLRSYEGYHTTCSCHVFLATCGLWPFLRFPLFWWLWQFWRVLVRCFEGCLYWNLCAVFLMIRLMLWVLERKISEQKLSFSSQYRGHILSFLSHNIEGIWFMTVDVDLDHLTEVLVKFLLCKLLLPAPTFSILYTLEGSHYT